jgi:transcriptional regulator with XRE-family HTH domain
VIVVVVDEHQDMVRVLRREWIRSGLTLKQMAERMGAGSPQAVSGFLDGRDIRLSSMFEVAHALRFEVALLEPQVRG